MHFQVGSITRWLCIGAIATFGRKLVSRLSLNEIGETASRSSLIKIGIFLFSFDILKAGFVFGMCILLLAINGR